MSEVKHYFLSKLKHGVFPHLPFEANPLWDAQEEPFFVALQSEMRSVSHQTDFQQKYPFEFLTEAEIEELEDDEYRRYLRFFKSERVEEMMYLDDQLFHRNTLDHLLGVHYLAMKTARHLKAHGVPVDLGRVSGSASGHDIGKYGVLQEDIHRIAYFHYYYSDEWYRKRDLENIGNVAVNHSTWDLELNSLSVESLILIYSDFQVKNNDKGEMHLFCLKDSFDVILNKLDNLDAVKKQRYRRVYEKLVDFERYQDQIASPTDVRDVFFGQTALLNEYKYEGIDEGIYMMHELRSPKSIRRLLERSFDEATVTFRLVVLRMLRDYHLYLTASQKDIVLEYLYRLILNPDELIRMRSSELLGQVLKHYDIVYRKEAPKSAPLNPIHRQKLRRIEQLDRFYHHRWSALTDEKRSWLKEAYERARGELDQTTLQIISSTTCECVTKSPQERYLENLKTAVAEEEKICNIDYLRQHDTSFHFVLHLINLVKVSSSRTIQRYASQTLLDMFDRFSPSEKNDVTIELLRSIDLAGNHLRIELPFIVGTILQKLPPMEVLEILEDVHLSVEHGKPSAPPLIEAIAHTLPGYLMSDDHRIAAKIIGILSSALVNRSFSIDQTAMLSLAAFYQSVEISLDIKCDFYLLTGKKFLILSRELESDFQARLNYSNYINGVYTFISQYENEKQWPVQPHRPQMVVSANFNPMNLLQKKQIMSYIDQGYEVFVHLKDTDWSYLVAPHQLRRVIAEMTIADVPHAYIWPSRYPLTESYKIVEISENDAANEQIRQAIQNDWQTSELLTPQVEKFIKTSFLYRNQSLKKAVVRRRPGFQIHEEGNHLWIDTESGRRESLAYTDAGYIENIQLSSQRGLHDFAIMLLNEAIVRLQRQGHRTATIKATERVSRDLLTAIGFEHQVDRYEVSLENPVLFIMDLPSRMVDQYRKEKRLRTIIAKNRRRIMTSLHAMYPGRVIFGFDRSMFYDRIIERITDRPEGHVVVPIGSMFQHHHLPGHPTQALYIDKLLEPSTDEIEVITQRSHLPIAEQVTNLKQLGEDAILIDDVLHTGKRLDEVAKYFADADFPIHEWLVGIATDDGLAHAARMNIPVFHHFYFPDVSHWVLESELYVFLGGLVSANSRRDQLYSLSLNRIAPFIRREPKEAFQAFSRTCIEAAERLLTQADIIFRERQGRPLRLSDLNHIVYDVLIPDVFFNSVDDMTIENFFRNFHALD